MAINPSGSILALDIGAKRVGAAVASEAARFARPLVTVENDADVIDAMMQICQENGITSIVCGLPRGMAGQETGQTKYARTFAAEIANQLKVPVYLIDEAVTSAQAEAELQSRGKPYGKGDIDALAATYILEDFLREPASAELINPEATT